MTFKYIALFPGQGSQKVGMGKELCQKNDLAAKLFAEADEALGFSLSKICFEGPEDKLTLTENVQPAILTVSTICYQIAAQTLGDKLKPVTAAGHSLGEYSALVAAGAISFADAVVLVNKRGKYMQSAVPVGAGKMLAVLGMEVNEIDEILKNIPAVQIANINAPGQIVVSGSAEGIEQFKVAAPGKKLIELPVSAPFHCKLMQPAQDNLAKDLARLNIKTPAFPVFSNFLAKALTNPEEIRNALINQVTGRVRWVECIQSAKAEFGIDTVVEFGAGNVLTGLTKRIDSTLNKINISSAEDCSKL